MNSSGTSSSRTATAPSPPPSFTNFLDSAERQILEQAGLPKDKPLVCAAAEASIEAAAASLLDECGSFTVEISAPSSAGLLLGGELTSARIDAASVAAAGLRATKASVTVAQVDFDLPLGDLLTQGPFAALRDGGSSLTNALWRPPNLKSPAAVAFSVRLSTDDINRSPVIFAALEALLRELLATGVSAAIGEALPRDRQNLVVKLVRVEAPQDGRIVLVADAEAAQPDGTVIRLSGMRVRCTPRASKTSRLLVLDRPELVSSFSGFGAKVELGLPFLRAAGLPLPDDLSLTSLTTDGGGLTVEGEATVRPIDYDELFAYAQAAAAAASDAAAAGGTSGGASFVREPPVAVEVDAEAGVVDVSAQAEADGGWGGALPPGR